MLVFARIIGFLASLGVVAGQAIGFGELCLDVEASLTCSTCPDCMTATCAAEIVPLPTKSDFWPPADILKKNTGPDPIPGDLAAELAWFEETVLSALPSSVKQPDTKYALTDTEEMLLKMSLPEWQEARAAETYTCKEMATAVTKRAMYLQDIQKMNHFMYWNNAMFEQEDSSIDDFHWVDVVLDQAADLDSKAEADGVETIAPLYCYPVPLKGTMVTKKFPSSAGFAVLQDKFGVIDAALVTLIANANGVLFGKTNVPELAHVRVLSVY